MDKEQLIEKFIFEYESYKQVDHNVLVHRKYTKEEINTLIDVGLLIPTKPYKNNDAFSDEIRYIVHIE